MAIRTLSARGVRGIRNELVLEVDGKSLLIFGDNGTGKSSFEKSIRWDLVGEGEPTSDAPYTSEESYR